MAAFEWPWQRWRREKRELEAYWAWFDRQLAALDMGKDVDPPWVVYPGSEPWWGGFRQGNGEFWMLNVWLKFWPRLDAQQREAYVERWQMPEEWRYMLFPEKSRGDG